MKRTLEMIFVLMLLAGCAGSSDFASNVQIDSPPVISRISPTTAKAGDTVTIFGFGFSSAPAVNLVSLESAITPAASYNLLQNPTSTEIESLTFVVPAMPAGTFGVMVMVGDDVSNSNVVITIQ